MHHPRASAVAICTDCEQDICAPCHGMDLRGFAMCASCRAKYEPAGTSWETDGLRWTPIGFARTAREVIMAPRTFFMRLPLSDQWLPPAVFGVISMAVGLFLGIIWQARLDEGLLAKIAMTPEGTVLSAEAAKFVLFATIPVAATILFIFHSLLLYFALKIFGVVHAKLSHVVRITGYASAAYLFMIVPPVNDFGLGHFLMIMWLFNLEVNAVRWFYNLGFWQSLGVVLIPFMFVMMPGV